MAPVVFPDNTVFCNFTAVERIGLLIATTPTQGLRTPPIARCGPCYLGHQHDRFRCPLRREPRAGPLRLGRANDHKPVLM